MTDPLDERLATKILHEFGIVPDQAQVHVKPLGGGVSSTLLLAEGDGERVVLKQPRSRFGVEDDWIVDDRRIFVEFQFLRAFENVLPEGSLPRYISFLPQFRTLIMAAAPKGWTSWKERLLEGNVEWNVAQEAAKMLAAIHEAGDRALFAGRFRHSDLFYEQRISPYFRTTAQRLPDQAPWLLALETRFNERADLVHGDFSPKNLMTNGKRIMLVDHEVVTRGDAAFDVAFMLSHLMLKSIHLPPKRTELATAATAFVKSYTKLRSSPPEFVPRVWAYVGGLVLARVAGKSPVEYLTDAEKALALKWGAELLRRPMGVEDLPSPLQA